MRVFKNAKLKACLLALGFCGNVLCPENYFSTREDSIIAATVTATTIAVCGLDFLRKKDAAAEARRAMEVVSAVRERNIDVAACCAACVLTRGASTHHCAACGEGAVRGAANGDCVIS